MKRLFIVFLFMGIAMLYFGCSENNPIISESDLNDQATTRLAKGKTKFTGTSNFIAPISPGTTTPLPGGGTLTIGQMAEWYDQASDPRVTGSAFWIVNKKINKNGRGKVWGSAELFVDGGGGKWELTWHGVISGNFDDGDLYIKGIALGIGVDGDVGGLNAKWTYILDQANVGFYYTSKGYIKDK